MQTTLIEFRLHLDALMQGHAAHAALRGYDASFSALRSLKMSKAWLGKALQELGNETPYPVADTPETQAPTAEVSPTPYQLPADALGAANALREELTGVIEGLKRQGLAAEKQYPSDHFASPCIFNAWGHATEARMHYGFALAEMREYALSSQPIDTPA
jgi:hypothetical protein